MKKRIFALVSALILTFSCCFLSACSSTPEKPKGNLGEVTLEEGDVFAIIHIRDYGDITVKLFPDIAPQAVKQFMTLSLRGYYDGKNFHRVIQDFMVQGGSFAGNGYDGEVAEEEYFDIEVSDDARHFYGALCFAKSTNGNYGQFYIVNNNEPQDINAAAEKIRGQLDDEEVANRLLPEDKTYYEEYYNKLMQIPDAVKEKYLEQGGDYELDGDYTVFGQTIDGFEVLDAISGVEVVTGNLADDKAGVPSKPLNDIVIDSIEIIKISEKTESATETSKVRRTTTTPQQPVVPETTDAVTADTASEEVPQTVPAEETSLPEETSGTAEVTISGGDTAEDSDVISSTAQTTPEDTTAETVETAPSNSEEQGPQILSEITG